MKQNQELKQLLQELEKNLLNPKIRKSEAQLSRLIHDDFVEFVSPGKIYDKAMVISALKHADECNYVMTDFYVKEISDKAALVTYNASREYSNGLTDLSLRSSIWRLIEDEWKIVFHQGTNLNK